MDNKLLVNVSCLETEKVDKIFKDIDKALINAENAAFKVATRAAFLIGVAIPVDNADVKITINDSNKLNRKTVYTRINKSKATLSRWCKALDYVIDKGHYNEFNSGKYPFSFDKIILIYDNEDIMFDDGRTFDALMKMSVSGLEALLPKNDEEDTVKVTFVYDGKTYEIGEKAMKKFLERAVLK